MGAAHSRYLASAARSFADMMRTASTSETATHTQIPVQQNLEPKAFHRFRYFPAEIRCMVWKYHAEAEEDFGKPRTITIIAKYNGTIAENNTRNIYVWTLEYRMSIRLNSENLALYKRSTFPWITQPAPSYKMPAPLYVNRESKDIGEETYSKSRFLMSIFGNEKTVYFRKDVDVLHFADWFTFSTFCLQFAFVQTQQTTIAGAVLAVRRSEIPTDEEDLPLHLRCMRCQGNNQGWNHTNPCPECQDFNPRERLDDYVKHIAIGTESRISAKEYDINFSERRLRIHALKYLNWGGDRVHTLVIGTDSRWISVAFYYKRFPRFRDRYKIKEDVTRYFTKNTLAQIEFLPNKAF